MDESSLRNLRALKFNVFALILLHNFLTDLILFRPRAYIPPARSSRQFRPKTKSSFNITYGASSAPCVFICAMAAPTMITMDSGEQADLLDLYGLPGGICPPSRSPWSCACAFQATNVRGLRDKREQSLGWG